MWTKEEYRKELAKVKPDLVLDLDNIPDIIKDKDKLPYHCSACGTNHSSYAGDMLRNNGGCPICGRIRTVELKKKGRDYFLNNIYKKYGDSVEILTEGEILSTTVLTCKCKEDNFIWEATYNSLMSKTKAQHCCPLCRLKNNEKVDKITWELFIAYMNYIKIETLVLISTKEDFKNVNSKITYKCIKCNKIYTKTVISWMKNPYCNYCKRMEEGAKKFQERLKELAPSYKVIEYNGYEKPGTFYDEISQKTWTIIPQSLENGLKNKHNLTQKDYIKKGATIVERYPWIIKYLKDEHDLDNISYSETDKVTLYCPDCGSPKEVSIKSIKGIPNRGFCCPVCSDSISYPNKLARYLIMSLPIDNYSFEKHEPWAKQYSFDVYFELNGQKYYIEMDGAWHSVEKFGEHEELETIQARDRDKDKLVAENGGVMIRIDCFPSEFNHIKEGIYNSLLNKLFDLSIVNWNEINKQAQKSLIVEVCKYFKENSNKLVGEIAKYFKISTVTVRRYLIKGSEIGLCEYDPKDSLKKNLELADKAKMKKILLIDKITGFIGEFESIKECSNFIYEDLQTKENCVPKQDSIKIYIRKVCNGKQNLILNRNYELSFIEEE